MRASNGLHAGVPRAGGVDAWAADGIREQAVQFAKGKSSATVKDKIKGDESVNYKLGAAAGQTMTVTLKPSNRSTYFNVMAPGADSAMFIGSTEGNKFSGNAAEVGRLRRAACT